MREAALTTGWGAALDQVVWLDEALLRREWQRTRRQWSSGRWMGLFTLLVLALWLPALTTGSYASSAIAGWHWPFASLSVALCVCGAGAGFLRGSQIWSMEARSHALEGWLLSRQRGEALAITTVPCAVVPTLMVSLPALGLLILTATQTEIRAGVLAGVLGLYLVVVIAGAAAGSASFFLQAKAVPARMAAVGGACLLALLLVLWLRVEYVEHGWAGAWEAHPGRVLFALLMLSPVPHLMGLAAPELWRTSVVARLDLAVPVGAAAALLGALYLGGAGYAVALSARGFQLLRDDPERLEHRPLPADEGGEAGSEYYWGGFRNPIWTREVRTRLRSREAVECIFFASLAVAVAGFFPLLTAGSQLSDPLQTAAVARQVFQWLTLTLGAFVMLVTPGLTAEAITLERERGTLDLLLCSPMRPREILHGKLLGAVSILVLLLSPSLPLFGLCTVFHGAQVEQVLGVYLVLGLNLAVCAYFGVTASAIHRQMVYAKGQAYVLSILFGIGPAGFLSILGMMTDPSPAIRQFVQYGTVLAFLMTTVCLFAMAFAWGHAVERLQYSEPETP
jgi:ABC-type transport system involved in multi-copper enzyme maturation permease subunit